MTRLTSFFSEHRWGVLSAIVLFVLATLSPISATVPVVILAIVAMGLGTLVDSFFLSGVEEDPVYTAAYHRLMEREKTTRTRRAQEFAANVAAAREDFRQQQSENTEVEEVEDSDNGSSTLVDLDEFLEGDDPLTTAVAQAQELANDSDEDYVVYPESATESGYDIMSRNDFFANGHELTEDVVIVQSENEVVTATS